MDTFEKILPGLLIYLLVSFVLFLICIIYQRNEHEIEPEDYDSKIWTTIGIICTAWIYLMILYAISRIFDFIKTAGRALIKTRTLPKVDILAFFDL